MNQSPIVRRLLSPLLLDKSGRILFFVVALPLVVGVMIGIDLFADWANDRYCSTASCHHGWYIVSEFFLGALVTAGMCAFGSRQFKLAEVARQANAAKSSFLARMSHELRTPLNGVVSNIELLQGTSLNTEQGSLLQSARLSADVLLHLIGDILDFSKIEAGKTELEKTTFRLPQIFFDLDAMFRARAMSVGLTFAWRLDGAAPERIDGDALRLKQVLINLVGNAMRYTKEGGILVRATAASEIKGRTVLRFEVIDSGTGLDSATASRLFEPFVQADASTARTHGGTGLGLAICKSLVDLWGGEIGVDGAVGEGARFWFTMPAKVVEPAPQLDHDTVYKHLETPIKGARQPMLVLLTPDRTDGVLQKHVAEDSKLPYRLVANTDEALRLCEEAVANGNRPPPVIVQESHDGPPPQFAHDLAARKAHCILNLYADDVRRYQRALRYGYAAFQPRNMDGATDWRAAMLAIEMRKIGTGSAPGNFGFAGLGDARDQLAQMKDSLRILILEDQPMNQLVIERQMSRLGLRHDVVENGILGLKRLEDGHYSLILCDCSMPEMDGFAFTRHVRAREKSAENPRVPIIALTANVFTEDVEQCYAAGMDDFLAKPVKLDELAGKILAWMKRGQPATPQMPNAPTVECAAVDVAALQDILGTSQPALVNEILAEFVESVPRSFAAVQAAVQSGRANDVRVAAHGAKGEARSAGASRLGDLYAELERQAKAGDHHGFDDAMKRIRTEIGRVEKFVASGLAQAA